MKLETGQLLSQLQAELGLEAEQQRGWEGFLDGAIVTMFRVHWQNLQMGKYDINQPVVAMRAAQDVMAIVPEGAWGEQGAKLGNEDWMRFQYLKHDLFMPLVGAMATAENVAGRYGGTDEWVEEQKQKFNLLLALVKVVMADSFYAVAEKHLGEVDFVRQVSMAELCSGLTEVGAIFEEMLTVRLKGDVGSEQVKVIPEVIYRVAYNLMKNSEAYARSGKDRSFVPEMKIVYGGVVEDEAGRRVKVSFRDNGAGFPREVLKDGLVESERFGWQIIRDRCKASRVGVKAWNAKGAVVELRLPVVE